MNITTLLHDVAKRTGNKTAIIENGRETSYRDLWVRIEKLATGFHEAGIRENHRVALILPNSSEFIYCFFALLKINAVVTPISPDCTPYEVKGIFDNLKPHAVIAMHKFMESVNRDYPLLLHEKLLITQGDIAADGRLQNHPGLKKTNEQDEIINKNAGDERIATIIYTYRGLGYPLGVMSSHRNYIEGVAAYIENTRMNSDHRILSLLPLPKVYPLVGCMMAPLISGATIIISKNYMPRSILKNIDCFKINHFTAVPTIYRMLLEHYKSEYHMGSLTCCITGGAYMSVEMQESIKARMKLEALQGYGLTECLPITWNRYELNKAGSLGLPLTKNFRIKIVDDNRQVKDVGQVGEIVINTPTLMSGYLCRENVEKDVLKDSWFYTGDYGYLDEDGYLHFVGVKKNIAKVGGNMVDLKEIQNVLLSCPHILEAEVKTKNDELWGQVIVAEIVAQVNGELSEKDISTFCSKRLSGYKIPKTIEFMGVCR